MLFLSHSPLWSFHVLLGALLLTMMMMQQQVAAQFPPFCDTFCWCDSTSDGLNPGVCPDIGERRLSADLFASEREKLASLVPDQESLVDFVGDEDCQPYVDVAVAMGVQKCKKPLKQKNDERFVCLLDFDEEECSERGEYSLETINLKKLDLDEIAEKNDRSVVTHTGSCGVCSSAQDLAANLNPLLNVFAFICSNIIGNGWQDAFDTGRPPNDPGLQADLRTVFDLSSRCFENIVGFSPPCAKMFASNAANTALNGCTDSCQAFVEPCLQDCGYDGTQSPLYGLDTNFGCLADNAQDIGLCATVGTAETAGAFVPPGTCNLNTCLSCDEEESGETFALFAGRTRRSSGIVTVGENPSPFGSAFFGLKRECDTVANIDAGICGTSITDYTEGLIEI
mmetsp:Transcript_11066/g.26307  ORF Transcript_11066/g.26307 Transcript_11066/m.26307 type:complete len:396 (+) Transcript_11066:788-1975(+)